MMKQSSSKGPTTKDSGQPSSSSDGASVPAAQRPNPAAIPSCQWLGQGSAASRPSPTSQYPMDPRQQFLQQAGLYGAVVPPGQHPSFLPSAGGPPRPLAMLPSSRVLNPMSELWMDVDGRPLDMPPYWLKGNLNQTGPGGGGTGLEADGASGGLAPPTSTLAQLGRASASSSAGGVGTELPPAGLDMTNPYYQTAGPLSAQASASLQYPVNKVNPGAGQGNFPPYMRRPGLSPSHMPLSHPMDRSPRQQQQQQQQPDLYRMPLQSGASSSSSKRPLARGPDDDLNAQALPNQEPWFKQARTSTDPRMMAGNPKAFFGNTPSLQQQQQPPPLPPFGFPWETAQGRERFPGGAPPNIPAEIAAQLYPLGGGLPQPPTLQAKLEDDFEKKKSTEQLQEEVDHLRQGLSHVEEVLNRSIKMLGQARSSVVATLNANSDKKNGGVQ